MFIYWFINPLDLDKRISDYRKCKISCVWEFRSYGIRRCKNESANFKLSIFFNFSIVKDEDTNLLETSGFVKALTELHIPEEWNPEKKMRLISTQSFGTMQYLRSLYAGNRRFSQDNILHRASPTRGLPGCICGRRRYFKIVNRQSLYGSWQALRVSVGWGSLPYATAVFTFYSFFSEAESTAEP